MQKPPSKPLARSPKLLFKEQWWGVSTFSMLADAELAQKITELDQYIEGRLSTYAEADINPKFVPSEADRQLIIQIASNLNVETQWGNYIDDFNYMEDKKTYKKLGYLLFRVRLKKDYDQSLKVAAIRPHLMQQIIFHAWEGLTTDFAEFFKFDSTMPPYIVSVCVGYDPATPHLDWNGNVISQNKQELGLWSEIYSGQFPDYRETLYESRVEGDISNRTSEVHIILRNSALIYMDPENYKNFFIKDDDMPDSTGYMFTYVITPTLRIRTISFAMIVVTSRIDQNAKMLIDEKYLKQPLKKIKDDLEKTTRLKNILQGMISPFFTDLSRSYRQHYTAVLHRLVDLYDIEKNWGLISQKVATNIQELNSIFLDKQEDAQKRQEKILSLVNVLLGASIVFEIVDILVPVEPAHTFAKQIVAGILGIIIVVLLVSFLRKSKD